MSRGKNRAAWMESARRVRLWLNRRSRGVAVGDGNGNGKALRLHAAGPGVNVRMSSGVDGLLLKGARVTDFTRLDSPAGMHGWFLATITPKERR